MRAFLSGWGIRLAIVGAILVGGFVLRDRLSGAATDLAVGDCFHVPQGVEEVSDVQHTPCSESHTAEVVFVGDLPDSGTAPDDAAVAAFVRTHCVPAFNTYTGRDYDTDPELDMLWLSPTSSGWTQGDHEVSCFAVRIDESAMTSSVRAGQ